MSLIWSLKTAILIIYTHERGFNTALICFSFLKSEKSCVLVSIVKVDCLRISIRLGLMNASDMKDPLNIGTVTASPEYYTCTLVGLLCAYCIIWLHVKDTGTDDSSSDDTNILILSDIWYQFLTDLFNLTAYLSEFNTTVVSQNFRK